MDENKIPGEIPEDEVKKEAVPPEVEIYPDLDEDMGEDSAENTDKKEIIPPVKIETEKKKTYPREKKRGVSVFALIMALIFAIFATFMVTYVLLNSVYNEKFTSYQLAVAERDGDLAGAMQKLRLVDSEIRSQYLYDIDEESLADGIMKGYFYGLGDKYAEYYNKEEMKELVDDANAEMQGIGITVVYNNDLGFIEITTVYPDSPAEKAGLLAGDYIVCIKEDGEYISVAELGYTVSVNKLRGTAGTKAEFGVFRDGDFTTLLDFSIERSHVTEITVTGKISETDKTVGIISISSFDAKTPEQFEKTYEELVSKGAEKIVFDVRNNPGGDLDSICSVLDSLLPEGPVIRTVDKDGNEEVIYTSDKEEKTLPMAVITNGATASAAELFTSAMKDYKKAVIVGEKTYGKGCMQSIKTFADGTGFKYTYRFYCPPFSDNYDGVGIVPDVEAKLSDAARNKNIYTLPEKEDAQLLAAVKSLNK